MSDTPIYTLGIDIGSTTSKCVILKDGAEIAAQALEVAGIGTSGAQETIQKVLSAAGLSQEQISASVVTGYGRKNFGGDAVSVSELSCHAMGAHWVFPEVRTIIDIGGQDAKVISLNESGMMESFVMNDKCAAGTGRFLDVMANILKLDISELEVKAAAAQAPVSISSTCTVFAESEVISQLSGGAAIPDVVAGICNSVASRVCGLARRVGIREQVCMSGGVALNNGVRGAIARDLGVEIRYDPRAQLFGAIGAALHAYKRYTKNNTANHE